MIVTPYTELEAVNEILSAIGSSPVLSIEGDDAKLNVDIINAKRILEGVSKEIQSRGYNFNSSYNVYLQPNTMSNQVPCPPSYLGFFGTGYKLVRREGYFFDMNTQSGDFPEGLIINLIVEVPFEELPEVFRKYITIKACRIFQARYLGSAELDGHLMTEEAGAYADIVDYDLVSGDYNVFEDDQTISQNIQRS